MHSTHLNTVSSKIDEEYLPLKLSNSNLTGSKSTERNGFSEKGSADLFFNNCLQELQDT
jgi:hypothetical protein